MLILCVILSIFVYGMVAATLGVVLPDLSARFSLSPRQNGVVAFTQALGLILASLAVGPLLDMEGDKIGLLLGLGLVALAVFLLPRCRQYKMVLSMMFIMGCGGGIVITAANALAVEVSGPRRAIVLNLSNLFFGLGGFLTPFIAANLFSRRRGRLCDLIAGLAIVAWLVVVATPAHSVASSQTWSIQSVERLLSEPALLLLGLLLFLYVSCEVGIWNWLPRYLVAQGMSESKALNILSLGFALGLLAGRIAAAPVLTRVSALAVVTGASAAIALSTYAVVRARRTWAAILAATVAGLAMAPVFPTTLAMVGDRFPNMTATALGIVITCGWIGLAATSRLIGAIAGGDSKKLSRALLVLPILGVLMLFVSISLRFIK